MEHVVSFEPNLNSHSSFEKNEEQLFVSALCGYFCGINGQNEGPKDTRGSIFIETLQRRYEAEEFRLISSHADAASLTVEQAVGDTGLVVRSLWTWHTAEQILSRTDEIRNTGKTAQILLHALMRFTFEPAAYKTWSESSCWAHENQLHENTFYTGQLKLCCQNGRTTQGATPYLFINREGAENSLALHLLPRGNWTIRVNQYRTPFNELSPYLVVEAGPNDENLRWELQPGQSVTLPEVLLQAVTGSQPESGAVALQKFITARNLATAKSGQGFKQKVWAPIVFNTWFDVFEVLDVERLRRQLVAAKKAGCEIFTIDAGWYGQSEGNWHRQTGDWREKLGASFDGKMSQFADEVRRAGLGFGLWMEPERFASTVPVVQEHPDWFLMGDGGFLYADLAQPVVYDYMLNEIKRLVNTYQLAWIKIDFNFELGPAKDELYGYYTYWYRIMEDLRAACPDLFIEGCASGGNRTDLVTLSHVDGHFLSDSVNPYDSIRMTQGAALRMPVGRLTKWTVLRSVDKRIVRYLLPIEQSPERVVTATSVWEDAFVASIDFCVRATLPGMTGYSGDLASLSESQLARVRELNDFYKEWREFLASSSCALLTPVRSQEDRNGWVAFQLASPVKPTANLLQVFRLNDGISSYHFKLQNLEPNAVYLVSDIDDPIAPQKEIYGAVLINSGLTVKLSEMNSAKIWIIEKKD
ncbi:MAG: alpha-galactosidase [Anaerolineaceae bacterium]|nr:alpha-galactosidase [Anaerolineaceae bacterium]